MNPIKRFAGLVADNGRWALYLAVSLLLNRVRLIAIRFFISNPSVYFQGPPKILGRRLIQFGTNFRCGRGAWIEALPGDSGELGKHNKIILGRNVSASDNLHVAAAVLVEIGDDVLIGSGVLITDHGHGMYGPVGTDPQIPPNRRPVSTKGPVRIGRNVWIGDGVKILSGVTVGERSIIGANTVVRENIAADTVYCIAGANKAIKTYDIELGAWTRLENQK